METPSASPGPVEVQIGWEYNLPPSPSGTMSRSTLNWEEHRQMLEDAQRELEAQGVFYEEELPDGDVDGLLDVTMEELPVLDPDWVEDVIFKMEQDF